MASLYQKMNEASDHLETKAEIVAYLKANYPAKGKGSWKQQIIGALSVLTGQKPKTLEKRFDPQRLNDPEPKNKQQYKELGLLLPPIPPKKGYKYKGTLFILYSECEKVVIKTWHFIKGRDAKLFAANPHIQGIVNVYNKVKYDKTQNVVEPCEEEEGSLLQIEAV